MYPPPSKRVMIYRPYFSMVLLLIFCVAHGNNSRPKLIEQCLNPERFSKISFIPKVDGDLEEWENYNYEILGCNEFSESSFSGMWKIGWREEGIYFALDMMDESLYNPFFSGTTRCLEGDSIEFFGSSIVSKSPESEKTLNIDYIQHSTKSGKIEIIDNESGSIEFLGKKWSVERNLSVCKGVAHIGTKHEAEIRYKFSHDNIKVVGEFQRLSGLVDVYLDGKHVKTFDGYSYRDTPEAVFFEAKNLSSTEHELVLKSSPLMTKGVFHARVNVDEVIKGSSRSISYYSKSGVTPGAEEMLLRGKKTGEGWKLEGVIKPNAFELESFSAFDVLRFGYKIKDGDAGSFARSGSRSVLGLRRHGDRTSVKWLAHNQGRLPLCILDQGNGNRLSNIAIFEDSISGDSWISFESTVDPRNIINPKLRIDIPSIGIENHEIKYAKSISGKWLYCFDSIRIVHENYLPDELDVTINLYSNNKLIAKELRRLPLEIRRLKRQIKASYEDYRLEECDPNFLNFIELVEQACIEGAEFMVKCRSQDLDHFYQLHHYNNKRLVDNLISDSTQYLNELIESNLAFEGFEDHPLQAWKSEIDGSWRQMRIIFPENFDTNSKYPLTLFYHGLQQKKHSNDKALAEYLNLREFLVWERPSFRNDIAIKLFGRGNSFKRHGEEELQKTLEWLRENHDINLDRITFYGGSTGASQAWLAAMRHPDLAWRLYLRSMFNDFDAEWAVNGKLQEWERRYKETREGPVHLMKNTEAVAMKLIVGENDPGPRHFMESLKQSLQEVQPSFELKIIPNGGHMGLPAIPWSEELDAFRKESSNVTFSTGDLRYNQAYGISYDMYSNQLKPMECRIEFEDGDIRLEPRNIERLSVMASKIEDRGRVFIGGEAVGFRRSNKWISFIKGDDCAWRYDDAKRMDSSIKNHETPGPIEDFTNKRFIIVYSTEDLEILPMLKRRVFSIKKRLSGLEVGQISGVRFTVKTDSELTDEDLENSSLWIIGRIDGSARLDKIQSLIGNTMENGKLVDARSRSRNSLVQFISPSPYGKNNYVYVELGSSPISYLCSVMKYIKYDYCVTGLTKSGESILVRGLFDKSWKYDEKLANIVN